MPLRQYNENYLISRNACPVCGGHEWFAFNIHVDLPIIAQLFGDGKLLLVDDTISIFELIDIRRSYFHYFEVCLACETCFS